jgi:hypothetical protein
MEDWISQGVSAFRETCYFGGLFIIITQFTDGHINNKRMALALGLYFFITVIS